MLSVQLNVNAAATVAIPLPATTAQWWPLMARDGDARRWFRATTRDNCRSRVKEGTHSIELSGPVTHVDRFELPFPMPPGSVSLDLKGWRAYGVQNGHLRGGALQFERESPAAAGRTAASLAPEPIAPYFRLSRTFEFGLEWRIHTTLDRVAPEAGSIPFAVPLVTGESLLSGSVRVENGRIIGVLPPDQQEIDWVSALATRRHPATHRSAARAMGRTMDAGAVKLLARRLRWPCADEARDGRRSRATLSTADRRNTATCV